MAWTAPITWTPSQTLTAAQLNTNLRDNMLEVDAAKATTRGSYVVATGTNALAERIPDTDTIATAETTASTVYVNLATVGPSVTCVTGTAAMVWIGARMENTVANNTSLASWSVSGATTLASSDTRAIYADGVAAANFNQISGQDHYSALTAGTNTFTMQYRVGGGTGTFSTRTIIVIPL